MRVRYELPLAALTLLFLLQGIAALIATLFTLVYDGVFERRQSAWLQMLLPLSAIAVPALPLARRLGRERLLAIAAAVTALARVALCLPSFSARWIASAAVVGAGAMFLSAAVGLLDRRALTAGAAGALLLEQLLRFTGWSWDVLLRPGTPLLAQLVISAIAAALAGYWLLQPDTTGTNDASFERRLGGMRLRGAVALGCILFLELAVLARPAVAARQTGVPYPVMACTLIAVTAAAVLLLAMRTLPMAHYRALTVSCALAAGGAAALAPLIRGWAGAALLVLGHAAALALFAPALTPAGGKRKGWTLSIAPLVLVGFAALHALTFFAAFTIPALHERAPVVIASAAILLALVLLVVPRPLAAPPIDVLPAAALAAVALLLAGGLALRTPPGAPQNDAPGETLDVASFNVHLGFTQDWRFDPGMIATTIRDSGAQLVALQEAPAGLMIAYGVDLPLWLAQHLGMQAYFAPSKGALLGDALLSRRPVTRWTSLPLPHLGGDRRRLIRASVSTPAGPLVVAAVHFGLTGEQQRAQAEEVVRRLGNAPRAVLLGDLNSGPGSATDMILSAAGLRDAFAVSGDAPAATWPALAPQQRIDWVRVRGYDVSAARISAGGGSDHRLVGATLVAPTLPETQQP